MCTHVREKFTIRPFLDPKFIIRGVADVTIPNGSESHVFQFHACEQTVTGRDLYIYAHVSHENC